MKSKELKAKQKNQCRMLDARSLKKLHRKAIVDMGLPNWVWEQPCINCKSRLEPISLRGITIKTNAQHFGNIALEFCCQKCNAGYELHYKDCCPSVDALVALLKGGDINAIFDVGFNIKPEENNLVRRLHLEEKGRGRKST